MQRRLPSGLRRLGEVQGRLPSGPWRLAQMQGRLLSGPESHRSFGGRVPLQPDDSVASVRPPPAGPDGLERPQRSVPLRAEGDVSSHRRSPARAEGVVSLQRPSPNWCGTISSCFKSFHTGCRTSREHLKLHVPGGGRAGLWVKRTLIPRLPSYQRPREEAFSHGRERIQGLLAFKSTIAQQEKPAPVDHFALDSSSPQRRGPGRKSM